MLQGRGAAETRAECGPWSHRTPEGSRVSRVLTVPGFQAAPTSPGRLRGETKELCLLLAPRRRASPTPPPAAIITTTTALTSAENPFLAGFVQGHGAQGTRPRNPFAKITHETPPL